MLTSNLLTSETSAMPTPLSIRSVVLEQAERISQSSKAEIERLIQESELKASSLESQITALIELRDRERAISAALQYLISPIRTLPVELLVEIFSLAIRDDTHIKDAFRISQVCVDWRHVAHNTPRFWTGRITVELDGYDSEQADGLRAWLARSATLPVPVFFRVTRDYSHRIPEEILAISHRWLSLRLHGWLVQVPMSLVRRVAECRLDSLEELHLGTIDQEVSNFGHNTIPSFYTAPRLRKLTMSDFNSPQVLMPWAQLADLSFDFQSPDTALNILAQCTGLVKASIQTIGWHVLPEPRPDVLPLNHLHSLSVTFKFSGSPTHVVPFFHRLSAPVLEDICLDFGDIVPQGVVHWNEAHFTAFLLRSPNITRLELRDSYLTSEDLRAVLRHVPSLTKLELAYPQDGCDDAFINALKYTDGVDPFVPRLHSLLLEGIDENLFTEELLAGMIASRWWTDNELASRTVAPVVSRWKLVQLRHKFSEDFLGIVEDLRRNGLNIQFLT
ncbi:hypothetical protein MVEN_00422600 [Mycena venus]|uniref:F-box domain-containing protein n=1 Tax=Mycena venus TaxID=2733690 RepID=A0A8H6YWA5_9AGAR|nr:hypothetical protein MVEN_00422600 [Mycena venus]